VGSACQHNNRNTHRIYQDWGLLNVLEIMKVNDNKCQIMQYSYWWGSYMILKRERFHCLCIGEFNVLLHQENSKNKPT
jgi:hypothetical protein